MLLSQEMKTDISGGTNIITVKFKSFGRVYCFYDSFLQCQRLDDKPTRN